MTYHVSYRADQWHFYQVRRTTAGQWQIVHQDLPNDQRLSVELHRTADGTVSVTDARIEHHLAGRTGKLHWRTSQTLHPHEVIVEEQPDA